VALFTGGGCIIDVLAGGLLLLHLGVWPCADTWDFRIPALEFILQYFWALWASCLG
jgi:hypothetical protein